MMELLEQRSAEKKPVVKKRPAAAVAATTEATPRLKKSKPDSPLCGEEGDDGSAKDAEEQEEEEEEQEEDCESQAYGALKKKPARLSKACYSVAWSRNQVMCRTGVRGPGQSHRIQFGAGTAHKTLDSAVAAARIWVQEH